METAVSCIERDDPFYIHQVSGLDLYLKLGITTPTAERFGPRFPDMTLIQFSIAMRKPKTLKDMLETTFNKCQVPFDQIITPITSNTKGNLFTLAIYFGSKCEKYENSDVECLKVLIDFFNANKPEGSSIDIENINGETPLIKAIDLMNSDAIRLLLENGADIHHKSKKNSYFETPLRHIFRKAETIADLIDVFERPLRDQKEDIIKNYLVKETFLGFLKNNNLEIGKRFIIDLTSNDPKVIAILEQSDPIIDVEEDRNEPPVDEIRENEVEDKCFNDPSHEGPFKNCGKCKHCYCEDCFDNHECND
ncbi:hypothetical protein M9Y10_032376 [Tritrichomonas musculus]|uniref:Ankyrin repeat protein n=1 Tax=Tritrichomonas musculus TaxID=1915356 RepID=A0ABR2GZE2_9EUKA